MFEEARSRNLQDSLSKVKPRISEVQSALPPRTMLLEYWLGAGRVAVLWVAKIQRVGYPGPHRERHRGHLRIAGCLAACGGLTLAGDLRQCRETVAGGVPLNRSIEQLLIVPDGILSQTPFEVLSETSGKRRC